MANRKIINLQSRLLSAYLLHVQVSAQWQSQKYSQNIHGPSLCAHIMYYAEHPFSNQGCNDYAAKFAWWMLKHDALGPSGHRYFHLWHWLLLLTPSSQHGIKFNGSKTQFIGSVQILWVKSNTRKYYSLNWIAWCVQPQLHSWSRDGYSCLFWKDF